MGALAITEERFRITSERYEDMIRKGLFTDEDKVELLDGEIVPTSPMGAWHMARTFVVRELLSTRFAMEWAVAQGVALSLRRDTRPEPDVVVVRRAELVAGVVPRQAALVVEIADTTLARDRRKAALYASAGIPEYWIVNRPDDVVEVYREPVASSASPTGFEFASRRLARRGEVLQAVESLTAVPVDELLGPAGATD